MASAEFDEKSSEKRPAVQVGDPFMEKLLLEACLELMQTDALIGVQDMGAAGLTCSTSEMGARGGSGIEIDVSRVPQRETGMTPYEIMLSESQERMLLVVKKGREAEVEAIFEKWDLHASHIGDVMNDGILRVKNHGEVVAEIPNGPLVDEAPVYNRPVGAARRIWTTSRTRLDDSLAGAAQRAPRRGMRFAILGSPTVASKRWVYRQYDHMVRTNSLVLAGMGAGVVRIKGTDARAGDVDRRQRPLLLPEPAPRRHARARRGGAQRRVRRRAADRRHQLPELRQSRAARDHVAVRRGRSKAWPTPAGRSTFRSPAATSASTTRPTARRSIRRPIIGVVGLIEDATRVVSRTFKQAGDDVVLLGESYGELGGSEYLKTVHGLVQGQPPELSLDKERALIALLTRAAAAGLLQSAHDCSDGGVAITLAECAFDTGGIGSARSTSRSSTERRGDALRRVGVARGRVGDGREPAAAAAVGAPSSACRRGRSGAPAVDRLTMTVAGSPAIDCPVAEAEQVWSTRTRALLRGTSSVESTGWVQPVQRRRREEMPFKDECGVFGIFGHPEAANLTYLGLYALQHRGQESAGIAAADGEKLRISRAMGQVAEAFNEQTLQTLPGHIAIGHTRYSTAGESKLENAQPFLIDCAHGQIAVGHNGNLVNALELRDELVRNGSIFQTGSDTEVILHLYARSKAASVEEALSESIAQVRGAYSLALLTKNRLIAARDPHGFRPLALGRLGDAWIVCSETCALDLIGAHYVRDVEPGELLVISDGGLRSIKPFPPQPLSHCVFEHVYFAAARQLRLRPQRERGPHRPRPHPGARSARRRRRRRAHPRLGRLRRDRLSRRRPGCR